MTKRIAAGALLAMVSATTVATPGNAAGRARPLPSATAIDAEVRAAMEATGTKSLALAVVDHGRVVYVKPFGVRTEGGEPLKLNSIMYAASMTKAVFAYFVLTLVDAGKIDLDTPIDHYLPQGLAAYDDPDSVRRYANFSVLAVDPRWHRLTPRILLNHSSGLANVAFQEPDERQRLHFDPGSHYAYSGMGLILLQLVLDKGLGLDVAAETQRRVFDPLGMKDTSFTWRDDFSGREATGWTIDGRAPGHSHQSRVRVAGSMDTTIIDMSRFAAALVSGTGLSAKSRKELSRPQLAITTASEFPTFQPDVPAAKRFAELAVGTGVISFNGPQGRGFQKGGHNDLTGNTMICLTRSQRCVVALGADVRAEATYPALVQFILGETGFPWKWIYNDTHFWNPGRDRIGSSAR